MKIKQTRQVRLDELLKYVWDNDINGIEFHSDNDSWVRIDDYGDLTKVYEVESTDLFAITEEVEITEDMVFPIVFVYWSDIYEEWRTADRQKTPIKDLKIIHDVKFIYLQNPDGSIGELIWKDGGLVD